MPSCPDAVDGRVQVQVGAALTAHVALLDEAGQMLDQAMDVEGDVEFVVPPGDYEVIVTSTVGQCLKVQRTLAVPPGEQPELLGLDWSAPSCNAGMASIGFELYGGGVFSWSLVDDGGMVTEQGVGHGAEWVLDAVHPGHYVLEVDHACMVESHTIDVVDPLAPMAEAEAAEVVVLDNGSGLWQAVCTSPYMETCRWQYAGQDWVEGVFFELDVTTLGEHEVTLEVQANGCVVTTTLTFTAVENLREATSESWMVAHGESCWTLSHSQDHETLHWFLYDLSGRLVLSGEGEDAAPQVTVPHPAVSGLYWLVLEADASATRKRLFAP